MILQYARYIWIVVGQCVRYLDYSITVTVGYKSRL